MHEKTGIFFQKLVEIDRADRIIIGLPFDGTTSNRPGTRFGPSAIREATSGVEDFSPYLKKDLSGLKFYDAGDLELPFGDPEKTTRQIYTAIKELLNYSARPIALGGEHLVSLPVIEAFFEKFGNDLFVIQLDAHADLRPEYLGVRLSHACVMHHISHLIGRENYASFGVRSGSKEEWDVLESHNNYFGPLASKNLDDFASFIQKDLKGKKIYLTVDLDVFDPSIMPGTGTPEPGGITFSAFITIMRELSGLDVVGADIVELSPHYDQTGISSALAATVLREIALI